MKYLSALLAALCLIGAPLIGVYLSGEIVTDYLYFPPSNLYLTFDHAPFSRTAFFVILSLAVLVMTPFLIKVFSSLKSTPKKIHAGTGFPWWGWIGVIIITAGWILAWSRFPWFTRFQAHTFSIPWLGYIILVNALTFMRSGSSMLTHQTRYFVLLFLFSAVFWWYFEYLNQFVENWYYVSVENMGRLEYFLYATLPFATVLPAVMGTRDLLLTFPRVSAGLDDFFRVRTRRPRLTALITFIVALAGLAFISLWPDHLFPLLWLAPLLIPAAIVVIYYGEAVLSDPAGGNWRNIYLLALSALICGFFWELWNFYSYTRWEYSVPFVNRFHLFEMPALGYAGYLPFGLQCGFMAWIVKKISHDQSELP